MGSDDAAPDPEKILDALQEMAEEPWSGEDSEPEDAGEEDNDDNLEICYNILAENAVSCALCPSTETGVCNSTLQENMNVQFDGIVMDHGAQSTVGGLRQYKAYCAHTKLPFESLKPSGRNFKFGDQIFKSLGVAQI